MLAGDFVTDDAGTGFVHMAPAPRRRRLRALRGERPRRPDDPQRAGGLVLRRARPLLRRPAGLRRQGQGGQGQPRRHRQADRGRRAARPRPDDPQLPALLALQGAGDLPQHPAVVRRHRQAARRRHGHLRRAPSASARSPRSTASCSGRRSIRPQPPLLDDRGPPRLGALAPARLGRAAHLLRQARSPTAPPRSCATRRSTPASRRPSRPRAPTPGSRTDAKARFLANDHPHDDWEKVTDILDVWFDSGSTHAFALRDRPDGIWPASVYLEGTDQHRGWFHSSMLQSCGTRGRAPYDAVVTHGFTLDENGMKMSKSLGNTTAPAGRGQAVRRRHPAALGGADRLRRRPAHRPGDPQGHRRQLPPAAQHPALPARRPRRLRRRPSASSPAAMPELERCMLHRLAELDREVREGYAAFDFQGVFQALFQFATVDLSAFCFDIRKDALYCDAAGEPAPPRRPHRARRALRTASSPGSRRCCPSPWRRSGSPASPATTARSTSSTSRQRRSTGTTPASPRSGSAIRQRPPRRHRRARGRAPRQAHRRQPRGRARGPRRRRRPARGARLGRLRRRLHHLRPRPRPTRRPRPDAFTLDDVPGVAVVPALAEGGEVRPLLEDPPRRRHPRPPGRLRALRRGARLTVRAARPPDGRPHGRREPVGGESFRAAACPAPPTASPPAPWPGRLRRGFRRAELRRGVHLEPV